MDETKDFHPGTPEFEGAADEAMAQIAWIGEHGTLTGFHAAQRAKNLAKGGDDRLGFVDVGDFLDAELPPPVPVLSQFADLGSKVGIFGPSKARKSFLGLQMAVSLASGQQLFGWEPVGRFKVGVMQFEITPAHYQRRVSRMLQSLRMDRGDVVGHIKILNGRGIGLDLTSQVDAELLAERVRELGIQVLIVDPAYKVFPGNENDAKDVGRFLAMLDVLANKTGALIVYLHHFAKGAAGDRATIDRGSGSGVWARDFDAALFLSPQKDDDDTLVVEPIARAYPPVAAFCVEFEDGRFVTSTAPPTVRTSADTRKDRRNFDELWPALATVLRGKEMQKGELLAALQKEGGMTR